MHPLSILHISDLHRDSKNEVRNKALLLSLEQDRDRHETPRVPDPNLINASGDIIHGVKHDAANCHSTTLARFPLDHGNRVPSIARSSHMHAGGMTEVDDGALRASAKRPRRLQI